MSEMTPEERAERIRRLQERRGTAADAPEVRRKRRRKHGVKTRVVLSALTLASFGSLVGAMAVGQGSGTTSVASASQNASAVISSGTTGTTGTSSTGTSSGTSATATTTPSTTSASTSSATSGTSSQSTSAKAVTSTKGS